MKKFFSLAMVVLLSISSAFATTVYCKMTQSWWTADGAAVGVHYWGGASSTTWPGVRMTEVKGETGMWSYDVPSDATGIIFTRVNGSGDIADWGAKTGDLTLPTDGKNLYTITSASAVWGDPGCTGEWSKYVVPTVTYTVTSTKAVSTTGTAPEGSAAVYSSTYGTKCQLTKDNSMTLTLSGYEGNKITGITLSMKSNKAGGAGKLVVKAGKDTLVYIADAAFNTKSWNGAYTTEYVNITPTMVKDDYAIQKDEDVVITIEATANSLYCQSFALVYEKAGSTPEPPTPEAKYYLTGDSAFVVDAGLTKDKAWDPAAIAVDADVYKLNLKADVAYKLKVTVDGKWSTAKGHSALSGTVPAGVTADTDDNICFTLSEAGEVVVTYNATAFTIDGKFKTSGGGGSTTAYYMKNNWNGATDWTWKAMEQDGANYKLSNVVFGGTGVNYNTAESDEGSTWVPAEAILGAKIGALDTVDLVLDPVAKSVTATLIGKYEIPSDAKYYMKNNWNGATDWTWKEMTKDGATYKLENVVFGGTGVNFNTKEDDSGATWVAVDAILGDKIAALDTVTLVLKPGDAEVTATLLGKYVAPVTPGEVKYYILGDGDLMGNWIMDNAIAVEADSYTFKSMPKGTYAFKVLSAKDWTQPNYGYSNLTGTIPAGVKAGDQNNIMFTIAEPNDVTITFKATGTTVETFTITGVFSTEAPKGFYITGNAALMGADKAWTPAQAIYEEGTTYTFKLLPAGIYQMKVLMTNTGWAGAMGYNELTTKPEGVTGDGDNNINFVLTETGDVKVTYVAGTTFTVEGNFYVVPTTPQYGLLIDGTTFVEATINPGNDQELMATNVSLTAGQTFVLYDNVNKIGWAAAIWKDDTSYKFQIENEAYKVTETGVYDFYLHVEMGADWLYVSKQGTSGLDNINGNNELRKVIENGVMYIYRDGHKYSVQGLLMY